MKQRKTIRAIREGNTLRTHPDDLHIVHEALFSLLNDVDKEGIDEVYKTKSHLFSDKKEFIEFVSVIREESKNL